jgi:hypothetical protein
MTKQIFALAFILFLSLNDKAAIFGADFPCPDPVSLIERFYAANDSSNFDESIALLVDDIAIASWSEGVNGHHMVERHLAGKEQVREYLGKPGLSRNSGRPDGMKYILSEMKPSGDELRFMLRPDRLRPNGKRYNAFRIEAVLEGCYIRSFTVVELIGWL